MNKLLVIIDETGGSRPTEKGGVGFGVGAILLPEGKLGLLATAAKEIGSVVGKADFKYRNVQENREARTLFIKSLCTNEVQCYGFFSSETGVAQEIMRTTEAGKHYTTPTSEKNTASTEVLMEQFLGYAILPIARHAQVNNYTAALFWDRRNDLSFIEKICRKHIDMYKEYATFAGVDKSIYFGGQATHPLSSIARLAGVLAGDIKQYFTIHGQSIWRSLDQDGLKGTRDPHLLRDPIAIPFRRVATINGSLSNDDPYKPSTNSTMLQGYYDCFLRHDETGCRLISFCDPMGHMGVLEIEHDHLWHITQLAD
ncbi:MAG: hypothetical protein Q8L74_09205 [Nitrospirota bacterium]|nr:hypothetical protein [Nitrospirota bacterium]MDP2384604.1 hypothetical protein [Nitrospirota bacterium]MDP3596157.1 hypothetical protein [Nitrospirota bacterium]